LLGRHRSASSRWIRRCTEPQTHAPPNVVTLHGRRKAKSFLGDAPRQRPRHSVCFVYISLRRCFYVPTVNREGCAASTIARTCLLRKMKPPSGMLIMHPCYCKSSFDMFFKGQCVTKPAHSSPNISWHFLHIFAPKNTYSFVVSKCLRNCGPYFRHSASSLLLTRAHA
jgi:hypothetical protein